MIKKVMKSRGHRAFFWRHNADKYGYFGPFDKNRAQFKTRQKGEIFSMMHVVSHRIWIKCIVYPLMYQKNAFFAPVFTLRSKVDLILTRAIGPIIAESAQFSKIVKKLNIDFCQFFSHWKEALFLLKSWNKIWGSPYSLLAELQKVHTTCFFYDFWERTGVSRPKIPRVSTQMN